MTMTDEQTKAYIQALRRELEGYERYDQAEQAAAVRAELKRVGDAGAPPAKRAAKLTKAKAKPKPAEG